MSETLTDRQRYARAYYAKNAERIKAQKKDKRKAKRKAEGKVGVPGGHFNPGVITAKPQASPAPPDNASHQKNTAPTQERILSARERIENMRIAQECGAYDVDW